MQNINTLNYCNIYVMTVNLKQSHKITPSHSQIRRRSKTLSGDVLLISFEYMLVTFHLIYQHYNLFRL